MLYRLSAIGLVAALGSVLTEKRGVGSGVTKASLEVGESRALLGGRHSAGVAQVVEAEVRASGDLRGLLEVAGDRGEPLLASAGGGEEEALLARCGEGLDVLLDDLDQVGWAATRMPASDLRGSTSIFRITQTVPRGLTSGPRAVRR